MTNQHANVRDDPTMINMPEIARWLGVRYETVTRWRGRSKQADPTGVPHRELLPPPDEGGEPDEDGEVKRPQWRRSTIAAWAIATQRMAPDGTPIRDRATTSAADPDTLDLKGIATLLKVQYQTAKIWRSNAVAAQRDTPPGQEPAPHPRRLPPALPDTYGLRWSRDEIVRWARQTGRMTPDGTPLRFRPPGRPRRRPAAVSGPDEVEGTDDARAA